MHKKSFIILSITFVLSFLSFNARSQDYTQDTLTIRAILDSNGSDMVSFEDVPAESDSSGRIIVVLLGGRYLTNLPSEIGNLNNLKQLDLDNNKLTELPVAIGYLTNLECICLDDNEQIKSPPEFWSIYHSCLWR